MKDKIYDVGIIGAGVAGMTAAIYTARADKSVVLIDKEGFGGQIAKSPRVKNIPGFSEVSGADFAMNMFEQFSTYPNIEHIIDNVKLLTYNHGLIYVCCENEVTYFCKTLIIATGAEHKELKLDTKDVYYCAVCDGPLFKGKPVTVCGSGNTGATYALELATYCKEVFLTDITMDMCCEPALQKQIESVANIHWLPNCTIKEVKNTTKGTLSTVTFSTGETVKCNAVFAAIGMIPKTEFAKDFTERDEKNYIIAGEDCINNKVPGIFVAGDCRTKAVRQVATAVADGATAAVGAIKYLNMH